MNDYSQPGDPYGIAAACTSQSATTSVSSPKRVPGAAVDARGNTLTQPRGIPTQAEADLAKFAD